VGPILTILATTIFYVVQDSYSRHKNRQRISNVIITSIEDLKEVKGKIIDPYNPIYLKIRSGKRTLSIPWEKIEAIGEE